SFLRAELQHPEPVLRRERCGDARLQRICRSGLAAEIDQGDCTVHRRMVRVGEGVAASATRHCKERKRRSNSWLRLWIGGVLRIARTDDGEEVRNWRCARAEH